MNEIKRPSTLLLALLISLCAVNAVLFSPALTGVAQFYHVSNGAAQHTISIYMLGYALGPLFYSPFANAFGRKRTLFGGLIIGFIGAILCIAAMPLHSFSTLLAGRCLTSVGLSAGYGISFTIVHDYYEPAKARNILALITMAFAIGPGVATTIGGILVNYFGWNSPFYAGAAYIALLFILSFSLSETLTKAHHKPLNIGNTFSGYFSALKNPMLITYAMIYTGIPAVIYIFVATAPFIAMDFLHASPSTYGYWFLVVTLGYVAGNFFASFTSKRWDTRKTMWVGLWIMILSSALLLVLFLLKVNYLAALFIPAGCLYFGMPAVYANAAVMSTKSHTDKANASAMMAFISIVGAVIGVSISSGFKSGFEFITPTMLLVCSLLITGLFIFARRFGD